jgi:hypothetical protein
MAELVGVQTAIAAGAILVVALVLINTYRNEELHEAL